ncbi:YaaC family protein [Saccharothrix deserti]|uniref:YaaC family protein n=1 Tax=Saccharothrix deserti TaxID=2593674 RepID=UPI00131B9B43|nr:YaaC family protein [Saccharothrix deserti]
MAVEGERRKVFSASLEQAEQLFAAASRVDWASRPILLFYGLSQAGRAIAAAANSLNDDDSRLAGHGIKQVNLDDRPDLSALEVMDTRKGSFVTLARALNSSTVPDGTTLGEIWQTIPELAQHPLEKSAPGYPPLLLELFTPSAGDEVIYGAIRSKVLPALLENTEEGVVSFLGHYPTLRDSLKPDNGIGSVNRAHEGMALTRAWSMPQDVKALKRRITNPYLDRNDLWVFPAVVGNGRPLHPLISWWAVLFALSMLARYEPSSWVSHLTVDESADATRLEFAQDIALDVCPRLILNAIETVAGGVE